MSIFKRVLKTLTFFGVTGSHNTRPYFYEASDSKYSINICSTVASLYTPLRHEEKMQDFFHD